MTGRGQKMLGLVQSKSTLPRTPLKTMTNLMQRSPSSCTPSNSGALDQMKRFLENLRTPAEMRMMDQTPNVSQPEVEHIDQMETNTVSNPEETEVAADALETELGRVNFGPMGFMTLGQEIDSNDNSLAESGVQQQVAPGPEDDDSEENLTEDVVASHGEESTVVIEDSGNKRTANDDTIPTQTQKRRKIKSAKKTRQDAIKQRKEKKDDEKKGDVAAKKGFKDNFLTVKFKLSEIQAKAGTCPDFALFIKDNVHSPDVRNAAKHAGKYLAFMKGDIGDKFFSKKGISFHPKEYFLCQNEVNLSEDKFLPLKKANLAGTSLAAVIQQLEGVQSESEEEVSDGNSDDNSEEESDEEERSDSDAEEDVGVDVYNTGKTAKKVSWGAPTRDDSENSGSSAGVRVYGRGAEKSISKEKKKKKADRKKHMKEASNKTRVDLLDNEEFNEAAQFSKRVTVSSKGSRGARQTSKGASRGASQGSRGTNRGARRGGKGKK